MPGKFDKANDFLYTISNENLATPRQTRNFQAMLPRRRAQEKLEQSPHLFFVFLGLFYFIFEVSKERATLRLTSRVALFLQNNEKIEK